MKKIEKKKVPTKKIVAKKAAKKPILVQTKPSKSQKIFSGWGILAIVNIIAFLAVLVVNYLAVSLPIGGISTGALSDLYPNLFTPAGLTFSIWGVIYTFLLGFVVRQIVDFYKKNSKGITKKIGIWFLLSCITNIAWIFVWQFQYVLLSVLVMIVFLIILIIMTERAQIGKRLGNIRDKWLVHVPLSMYLGRISVAIIANIAARLVNIGWNMRGMTDIFRTILVIIVATLVSLLQLYKRYNIIFALVVIRAFIGIIIKRVAIDPVYANNIIWTLGICIAIISIGIGMKFEAWRKN